jgi:sugar phosphate isomerase/epimerase
MSNREVSVDRRKFLGIAAGGAAAAAATGPWVAKAISGTSTGKVPLIPAGSVGIQQFSIRDSITRVGVNIYDPDGNVVAANPTPTMGFLAGPNYPNDPTDVEPTAVPLPGGFLETFQYLKSIGYDGIEFFQFSQNVASLRDPAAVTATNPNGQRQPTIAEIKKLLDKAGLKAFGTHTGGVNGMYDPATGGLSANGLTQIQNAKTLGYAAIGQAGDPTSLATLADRLNANGTITPGWTEVAKRSNIVGELLWAEGIRYFYHPEQNFFQFFDATVHPELKDVNRLEWFIANTDRRYVYWEPDILHSYSGADRFPKSDGSRFDPFKWVMDAPKRVIAYHLKDGDRNATWAGPPAGGPYVQNKVRPGTNPPLTDGIASGEGHIGKGDTPPDPKWQKSAGFGEFIQRPAGRYQRLHLIESDGAVGGASDPARSLRHARISAQIMTALKQT